MMMAKREQSSATRPHRKITSWHQERLAYIYVRQSTTRQMHRNQESQQYQYRLQQRAQELGWPAERIKVIDSDLGLSGRHADIRTGFQELVAAVSLGSEAELPWLRQRLDEGRMLQVKRGVYRQRLPTGLERLPDGTVVKHPDDQVRHVLDLLFAKFEELSSMSRVVRYFRQQKIQLPRRQSAGPHCNQILWKDASESAVTDTLQNPAYAGAFAYGRRQVDPTSSQPGRPATGRIRQPMEKWLHLQQDVYPAYISWEQYLANQERIRQNGLRFQENGQWHKVSNGKALVSCKD